MMMMMMKVLCLLIVVALVIISCGSGSAAEGGERPVTNPIVRSWIVEFFRPPDSKKESISVDELIYEGNGIIRASVTTVRLEEKNPMNRVFWCVRKLRYNAASVTVPDGSPFVYVEGSFCVMLVFSILSINRQVQV